MKITSDIKYVGVNDHEIDLFEGQYPVPNGMAYNSYVILDEKVAVLDTVEKKYADTWLKNIENIIGEKEPSFLVIHHMEPDHSSNINEFMEKYKNAKIVASEKAFLMMKQFFGSDYKDRQIIIKENDALPLGKHTLLFKAAPMVHWPEVMVSYDTYDKALFSSDAFGKFGALDMDDEWACEARRYYFGIVGKYGQQVKTLLSKVSTLDVSMICPLHGPALTENLGYYLDLYKTWSSYEIENDGILISFTSVYGNTKKAAELLRDELIGQGKKVILNDLARMDIFEAVEDAFRYGTHVLATTTYNNEIFPKMREFLEHLKERNYQKRTVAIIENGSWAPSAQKKIREFFLDFKEINILDTSVTIKSSLTEENIKEIKNLSSKLI